MPSISIFSNHVLCWHQLSRLRLYYLVKQSCNCTKLCSLVTMGFRPQGIPNSNNAMCLRYTNKYKYLVYRYLSNGRWLYRLTITPLEGTRSLYIPDYEKDAATSSAHLAYR